MDSQKVVDTLLHNAIVVCIIGMLILIFYYSSHRSFNFDEFQVLYASASLDRGKAIYADDVGGHFPLMNIAFAIILKLYGFETTTLILARIIIFVVLCSSTFFIYKIGKTLKDPGTGTLAVILTLSSLVFINKGIEIRHDVFNMFFNVAGVYYLVRSLLLSEKRYAIISALCMGCALASTQKAAIWIFGIGVGVVLCVWRKYRKSYQSVLFIYPLFTIIPLFTCFVILLFFYNETTQAIFQVTIVDRIGYITPGSQSTHSFPYEKMEMFFPLLYENGLLYSVAAIGMIFYAVRGFRSDPLKLILVMWAFSGLMFYLLMKRPFYQSFLPTIPPLSLLAALLLSDYKKLIVNRLGWSVKGISVFGLSVFIVLFWPIYLSASKVGSMSKMTTQMDNLSFCVSHLNPDDKVLCFTQQQIFFDPIFKLNNNECGKTIFEMDEECFEKRMIEDQCKVVIYDYRTRLLKKAIQSKIAENYRTTGIGHILIPGFTLKPNEDKEKKVWIPGTYYVSHPNVVINGKRLDGNNLIKMEKRAYSIQNLTSRSVVFLYLFNSSKKNDETGI